MSIVFSPPAVATGTRRLGKWALVVGPFIGAALVLIATRHDPLLSPDSITYLSAAEHVRGGHGLVDFTNKPLAVFGPVYPLLLALGGRSLVWATILGALSIAAGSLLMGMLLRGRVRYPAAIGGAFAFAASHGFVRMASVVWSEAPYAAIALGMLVVLSRRPINSRTAAIGGLLAGLGFLTRYAGIGLFVTGAVIVIVSAMDSGARPSDRRASAARALGTFAATAAGIASVWIIRNLVETGQPLGPRFEGGSVEPLSRTVWLALVGTGNIVVGDGWSTPALARIGTIVVVAIAVMSVFAISSRATLAIDLGMATFFLTSFVIPIIARRATANDIELRVMSPMLIPLIYFAVVTFDRLCTRQAATVFGIAALAFWMYQGVAFAARFPDLAPAGAGYKAQFSPQLYDIVDHLPADARVLTNNPQRVWWFTRREPTLMAFTRPRPGNSHYPLDADDTLREACTGRSYLAWFDSLQNAGSTPQDRRPDLASIVDLQLQSTVPGGQLYLLAPADPASCQSDSLDPVGQG